MTVSGACPTGACPTGACSIWKTASRRCSGRPAPTHVTRAWAVEADEFASPCKAQTDWEYRLRVAGLLLEGDRHQDIEQVGGGVRGTTVGGAWSPTEPDPDGLDAVAAEFPPSACVVTRPHPAIVSARTRRRHEDAHTTHAVMAWYGVALPADGEAHTTVTTPKH